MNAKENVRQPVSFGARVVSVMLGSVMLIVFSVFVGLIARLTWSGFSWGWDLFGL